MTFENLPAAIRRLSGKIDEEVNRATQEVAAAILTTAANETPVDTTKAISNWQVGIGTAPASVRPPHVPGKAGSTKQESVQITIGKGRAAMKGRTVGTEIHIANNAPYIEGLNDGSISQQPGGFVQKAELSGRNQIAATKLDLS